DGYWAITNYVNVLLGHGDGALDPARSTWVNYTAWPWDLGGPPGELASGDFNGDGKLDLVAADGITPMRCSHRVAGRRRWPVPCRVLLQRRHGPLRRGRGRLQRRHVPRRGGGELLLRGRLGPEERYRLAHARRQRTAHDRDRGPDPDLHGDHPGQRG